MSGLRETSRVVWHPTGLRVSYDGGRLWISALNPEAHIQHVFTRWQMLRLGWWFVRRGIRG